MEEGNWIKRWLELPASFKNPFLNFPSASLYHNTPGSGLLIVAPTGFVPLGKFSIHIFQHCQLKLM